MISINILKIYKRYNGNSDAFVRSSTKEEKEILNYVNWKLIDELIQDISLMKKGLVSQTYKNNITKKLTEVCDSKESIEYIINIAEQLG